VVETLVVYTLSNLFRIFSPRHRLWPLVPGGRQTWLYGYSRWGRSHLVVNGKITVASDIIVCVLPPVPLNGLGLFASSSLLPWLNGGEIRRVNVALVILITFSLSVFCLIVSLE
jgi:hypothetical protein